MIHGSKVQTREKIQDTQQKQSGSSIRPISMKISWTLNKVTYKKIEFLPRINLERERNYFIGMKQASADSKLLETG